MEHWIPLQRPKRLSDPFAEFCYQPDRLAALLDADIERLDWLDIRHLFCAPSAGTFAEVAWFLPGAFQFLASDSDHVLEVLPGFLSWLSYEADGLQQLAVSARVEAELRAMLVGWTRAFHVWHYDAAACRSKGWVLAHFDLVEGSERVTVALYELVRGSAWAKVAEAFVESLARGSNALDAAWFLEIARQEFVGPTDCLIGTTATAEERSRFARLLALERPDFSEASILRLQASLDTHMDVHSPTIMGLVRDRHAVERAVARLKGSDLGTSSPTYWRDTRLAVGAR